jgi:transcriptional regulator with XRE-family HTH domain
MTNLETNIKARLEQLGWTITQLASSAGTTEQTLHNLFNKGDAKLSLLSAIADAMMVTINYLVTGQERNIVAEPVEGYKLIKNSDYTKLLEDAYSNTKEENARLKNPTIISHEGQLAN